MEAAKTLTPDAYIRRIFLARKGGLFRGMTSGMSRNDVIKTEGDRGLAELDPSSDDVVWRREIAPYDAEGNAAREEVVAFFEADVLRSFLYVLQVDGPLADEVVGAVMALVVARFEAELGKASMDGKDLLFPAAGACISVSKAKVSRNGEGYSRLSIAMAKA